MKIKPKKFGILLSGDKIQDLFRERKGWKGKGASDPWREAEWRAGRPQPPRSL
jgi:hypothetical protein